MTTETTTTFEVPGYGYKFEFHLEPNHSTTIILRNPGGGVIVSWNSGKWFACHILGAGVGIAVTSYTGNPRIGALAGILVSYGCGKFVHESSSDGDQYEQ